MEDGDRLTPALAEDLRRAAAGEGLPATSGAVRAHVERLMTDAATEALELERVCRASADGSEPAADHLQAQIDELRSLTGALRRRFAVRPRS